LCCAFKYRYISYDMFTIKNKMHIKNKIKKSTYTSFSIIIMLLVLNRRLFLYNNSEKYKSISTSRPIRRSH
jgi:hypothetical protein